MAKSRDAFRTISEVSEALDTPTHVLRFWESKFVQIKPVKRAGGRRYYRPEDLDLLAGIKTLLHEHGMTIKGAQKMLKEQGVKHVSALGAVPETDPEPQDAPVIMAPETEATPAAEAEEATVAPAPKLAVVAADLPAPVTTAPAALPQRSAILADIAIPNQIMIQKNAAKIAPLVARLESLRDAIRTQ